MHVIAAADAEFEVLVKRDSIGPKDEPAIDRTVRGVAPLIRAD